MDQPGQQSDRIWDTVINAGVAVITAIGTWVITRTKAKADVESATIQAAPQIETEYIKSSRELTEDQREIAKDWRDEAVALRAHIDNMRADYEAKLESWRERTWKAESKIPLMEAEIMTLKGRVAELERQVNENGKGREA